MLRKFKAFYALCFCSISLHSFSYTSSDTPPEGVRAAAFVYGFARNVDSTLNSSGRQESLSAPLNRSVTLNDFAENQPRLNDLRAALNGIEAGLGEQLLHANLYGDVKVDESHYVTGMLWGLTDKFSIGALVPVIERNVRVKFRADVTNNAAAINSRIGNIPEVSSVGLQELANTQINDQTFIDSIFLKNGYQSPRDFKKTSIGDAEIESRYRYFNSKRIGLALRGRLQMPTTQYKPDIRNIADKDMDESNWALKLAAIQEFRLIPEKLDISTALWGKWRAPHKRTMAFRKDDTQSLPNLNDPYQIENVTRQRGAEMNFSSGANLSFFKTLLNFMGTYHFTKKQSDRIYGQRNLQYNSWTDGSATELHAYETGIEISTISAFLRNKFPAPGRISLSYFKPFSGKNTYYAPYWRLDVIMLF